MQGDAGTPFQKYSRIAKYASKDMHENAWQFPTAG
jgi:hypothetical protein